MLEKEQDEKKYEIPHKELSSLITKALGAVELDDTKIGGDYHKYLSQSWVKYFAKEFRNYYKDRKEIDVFYRDKSSKEFLFDISIGECSTFKTIHSKKPLKYISKAIWQIESEFVKNATEIAYDFSKLFSGNAPFKMMVGPLREKEDDDKGSTYYMDKMKIMAKNIPNDENWYFLLIIHPENWKKGEEMIWKLYKWNGRDWGEIIAKDKWNTESENHSPF